MKLLKTFEKSEAKTSVALGFFDGVHRAHLQVINKAVAFKASHGYVPTVFTFAIDGVVPNKVGVKTILTDKTKLDLFSRYGIEMVYMPSFSEIAQMTAEEFFNKILVQTMNARAIVCGYDYSFGKGAEGDSTLLAELCDKNNIECTIVNPMERQGEIISSTAIRNFLSRGKIKEANDMLGYDYFINAKVCHGAQVGRTLGFPTINQNFEQGQLVPKNGVYHSTIYIGDHIYKGITNIGVKPTFGDEHTVCAETHIIGFDDDVYDKVIMVGLNHFIRAERKFDNIEDLKNTIKSDLDNLFLW